MTMAFQEYVVHRQLANVIDLLPTQAHDTSSICKELLHKILYVSCNLQNNHPLYVNALFQALTLSSKLSNYLYSS